MALERLTWEEIQEKYPNQWVGLVDVEWKKSGPPNVVSAIVKYTDKTGDELILIRMSGEDDMHYYYTTPKNTIDNGCIVD